METLGDAKVAKSSQKVAVEFYCEKCDYVCCKLSNWKKHILTAKHIQVTQVTLGDAKVAKSSQKVANYFCERCGKTYSSRNGLWKHKKVCSSPEIIALDIDNELDEKNVNNYDDISTKDLVLLIFKQNSKVQDALIEMSKQICTTNNTTLNNSHNNNTTNNSFNLQFFLNETCKNAMNITDFANSINLQLADLISVGELGYVEGISNIIVKNLNALDITERPVHCTDKKREIIYIKDADKWERDEDEKKLKKFIKSVAFKNQKMFSQFKEKYPDCNDSESKYSDQYSKIVIESLDDNNPEKEEKIIKKISRAVTIDKKTSLSKQEII